MPGSEARLWIVASAYAIAGACGLIAGYASARRDQRLFWVAVSVTLMVLAIAKELQLQARLSNFLRMAAREHHLYDLRAFIQYPFILVVLAGVTILARRGRVWLKGSPPSVASAAIAIVALIAFILIRATSVHVVDIATTREVLGLRSGWWIELAGLLVIGSAAITSLRRGGRLARSVY